MKRSLRIIAGLAVATLIATAQEAVQVDFRNYIPGVLDAPVFYPDGVTRVGDNGDSFSELAQLYYGKPGAATSSFQAVFGPVSFFQGATNAGYWVPTLAVLPDVKLGERIWVQVRVWEYGGWIGDTEFIGRKGCSKVLSLVVTNPVMTLAGLESFRLSPEPLWCELKDGQVIISWCHQGALGYWLESTEDLATTTLWDPVPRWSTGGLGSILSVTNPLAGPQRFYRVRRWPP